MKYEVDADIYEGSLPLLVELAKLNLIDVFLIKLVALTGQYLQRVKAAGIDPSTRPARVASQSEVRGTRSGFRPVGAEGGAADIPAGLHLNELAEPLPLLGNLVALKARGLLPQPPPPDEEEVPISLQELERRLREYEQFKTVAQLLAELHALQHQHFARLPGETPVASEVPAPGDAPLEVSLTDLMSAFAKVLEKAAAPLYEITAEPWTVEMKTQELRVLLTVKRQIRFLDLFTSEKSKLELVVIFLALLELMRQRFARAIQERHFSDILIVFRDAPEAQPA